MAIPMRETEFEFVPSQPNAAVSDGGVRSRLIVAIGSVIAQRGLTIEEAAQSCGTSAAQLSALLHGRARAESMDQLVRWLSVLGRDVEIIIRRTAPSRSQGRLIVLEPM